jgi:2-polyprenyl-6-methoxyphenol hydroxylase-like FAD-dependent oxidoreductase
VNDREGRKMQVLVVGAGPTGLVAALALAKGGVTCRIVERRTAPSELSRAVGIMPVTIQTLRNLGAAKVIEAEAMPIRKVHLARSGRPLMQLDNTAPQYAAQTMLGLPQNRTEEVLRDALAEKGVQVEYGLSVMDIRSTNDSADVEFSDGTTQRFDWVIGADGIGSTVRQSLGIAYPGFDLPQVWSIADVDIDGPFDEQRILLDVQQPGNAFIMVLPIEARRARIVSSTDDAIKALNYPISIAKVRRTGTFTISVRQAETYIKGRVLLAGDAAHCHSPMGGKGMNLGIADAAAAAEAILNGTTGDYSQARHAVGTRVMKNTEVGRRMVTSNAWWAKAVLRVVTKLIVTVPGGRAVFLKGLTQL